MLTTACIELAATATGAHGQSKDEATEGESEPDSDVLCSSIGSLALLMRHAGVSCVFPTLLVPHRLLSHNTYGFVAPACDVRCSRRCEACPFMSVGDLRMR